MAAAKYGIDVLSKGMATHGAAWQGQRRITMTIEERTYHIMGTTSILGSSPANPAVRSAYLASKAKDPTGLSEEESAYLPDEEQKGITVFLQDDEDASCMYLDYQIRGFFKSALNALEYDNKIKQAKSCLLYTSVGHRRRRGRVSDTAESSKRHRQFRRADGRSAERLYRSGQQGKRRGRLRAEAA